MAISNRIYGIVEHLPLERSRLELENRAPDPAGSRALGTDLREAWRN